MLSTVSTLADFFEVSPLYLIGESDDKNGTVELVESATPIAVNATTASSRQVSELIRIFGSLSLRGQTKLLSYAFDLESEEGD